MIKKFPFEKYKFVVTKNMVVALSTYEGKCVRGVAKCDPVDTFDEEKGKKLAAARCNAKVCSKRLLRATRMADYCEMIMEYWAKEYEKMCEYKADALAAYSEAMSELESIQESM